MTPVVSFNQKYKILQKIGDGSFSDVVKCEEIGTGKLYAAKVLRKAYKNEKDIKCCAEVKAMQKVRWHPNLIRLFEYFYDHAKGRIIFVMELMDISLHDFIQKKKRCVSENKAKYILYQILKGLDHLHKTGLFHRDVKPENVLMRLPTVKHSREIVKLADLGSIRGIYSKPPYTEYISTRWYRAPECLLTVGHYGAKMDIWAAGCVFYEVVTLKPLFAGKNEVDQLAKIHAILGTPTPTTLNKLKSKSENVGRFLKQHGAGLESVAKNMSDSGMAILKLMIQYDPNRRISARRLVEHAYFNDLREQEIARRYNMIPAMQQYSYHQHKGDYSSSTTPNLQNYATKQKHASVGLKIKLSSTQCGIKKSKTYTDLECEIPLKPKGNNLSGGSKPIVRNSEIRGWGLNPFMLAQKNRPIEKKPIQMVRIKRTLQKREPDKTGFVYSKTTSDLSQVTTKGVNQFQSKSFAYTQNKQTHPKIFK